jgi:hypothetical protein
LSVRLMRGQLPFWPHRFSAFSLPSSRFFQRSDGFHYFLCPSFPSFPDRFLKEKAAYDKVLAHLHTRDEELKAHQEGTLRQSQILGEQTAKVEQLRNAKAVDDRMRAEKLAELRK